MPFQAWIHSRREYEWAGTVVLQWGHALSGMDTPKLYKKLSILYMLQWGHALSGMDTAPTRYRLFASSAASMGPCPFRHGYEAVEFLRRILEGASMGPCPFRHGYDVMPICSREYCHSFNGAMPFQAWILGSGQWLARMSFRLQWGHALSGMDTLVSISIPLRCVACFNGAMPFQAWIQRQDGQTSSADSEASMGPCPFRHGYASRDCALAQSTTASMGPCPFRHGYSPDPQPPALRAKCFNGAMPFQAWILYPLKNGFGKQLSFNGAMPFQAWICAIRMRTQKTSPVASMGPCPFRHGYVDGMSAPRAPVSASMGPCIFRHGYVRVVVASSALKVAASMGPCPFRHGYVSACERPDCRRATRFNGAMPFQAWIYRHMS